MKNPKYEYSTEDKLFYFEFTSIGPKGRIKKLLNIHQLLSKTFLIWLLEIMTRQLMVLTTNQLLIMVIAKKFSLQLHQLCTLLPEDTLRHGFMQQEVLQLERVFTGWELQII